MANETPDYYAMVEDAWRLSDAAREYVQAAGREVGADELWTAIFSQSPLVDQERSNREGGQPREKIFLTTPYGLQYRFDHKDWVPFRHGPLDPAPTL